jgi:hypothetical protein
LRAPNDDPAVIAFPTPAEQIQRRTVLGRLISGYQQAWSSKDLMLPGAEVAERWRRRDRVGLVRA